MKRHPFFTKTACKLRESQMDDGGFEVRDTVYHERFVATSRITDLTITSVTSA